MQAEHKYPSIKLDSGWISNCWSNRSHLNIHSTPNYSISKTTLINNRCLFEYVCLSWINVIKIDPRRFKKRSVLYAHAHAANQTLFNLLDPTNLSFFPKPSVPSLSLKPSKASRTISKPDSTNQCDTNKATICPWNWKFSNSNSNSNSVNPNEKN